MNYFRAEMAQDIFATGLTVFTSDKIVTEISLQCAREPCDIAERNDGPGYSVTDRVHNARGLKHYGWDFRDQCSF
jgi:hypothetical protein